MTLSGTDAIGGDYLCISVNHRKADVPCLESMFFDDVTQALHQIRTECRVSEVVLVQTCNRIEPYVCATDLEDAASRMVALLKARSRREDIEERVEVYYGNSAVNHLLRVSTSLDSMLIGEHEILGQVSDALTTAIEVGTASVALKTLFRRAIAAGKRARTETDIGKGPISVAHSAVDRARSTLDMGNKKVIVVGAGKMGSLLVNSLKAHGADEVVVLNRTVDRASWVCERCGYKVASLDELAARLGEADVAFVSTSSASWLITQQELARREPGKPILIFDLSNPRNVDPAVSKMPGVTVKCLDDLRDKIEQNRAKRIAEAEKVERIIAEEHEMLAGDLKRALAGEALRGVLVRSEEIRMSELERAAKTICCADEDLRVLEAMSKSIVSKIMDPVIDAAKTAALSDDSAKLLLIAELFKEENR